MTSLALAFNMSGRALPVRGHRCPRHLARHLCRAKGEGLSKKVSTELLVSKGTESP